ncbi:MAG: sugar transferase [Candidatus Omnitrophica bacterium]|nr:sugar transferase [Candidatus Omnitrophota bacterium]
MISRTLSFLIRFSYVLIDIGCICASIFLAASLRQSVLPVALQDLFFDVGNDFHLVFVFWFVTVLFFNGVNGLYQTRRESIEAHEIGQVMRSVFSAVITVLAFVYSMKIIGFPRSVFLLTAVFTTVFFCLWRFFKRIFVRFLAAHGYNNFNVLIIGAGTSGMMLAQEIKRYPGIGMNVVGFLDDVKTTSSLGHGQKVLGTLAQMEEVIRKNFVQTVFFTVHPAGNIFSDMIETAKNLRVAVRVVPLAFDSAVGEIFKFNIGYIPVLEYSELGRNRMQYGKRLFDLLLAGAALVCLLPFFLLIALWIRIDSSGPAFYRSRRYGRGGRIFKMWKFRSMVVDAEERLKGLRDKNEVDGPIFKIRVDPRVTSVGRFLRKYSIDELPQLMNVLTGDMSLVGPRPLPLDQVETEDLKQLKRLEVRPGITGLWQVRGRSDLPFHRLVKWDSWYVNNWSFLLDISILVKTIPVVIKGKGAY